jgi:hypothetical protein
MVHTSPLQANEKQENPDTSSETTPVVSIFFHPSGKKSRFHAADSEAAGRVKDMNINSGMTVSALNQ